MSDRKNIVAIIPARGGSKGLPRKNVLDVGGKPLIAHSILAARECAYVGRTIVSTEDQQIKDVALRWNAEVVDRPPELATDEASSEAVIRQVLLQLDAAGSLPELFVLLQPTSPLRSSAHVTAAVERYRSRADAGALVSVCGFEHPPQRAFLLADDCLEPLLDWETVAKARQHYPPTVRPNGAIYLTDSRRFLATGSLYSTPVLAFPMSREASVDIDGAEDLEHARSLLSTAHSGKLLEP
jgi:CMP-N,N'-diacetyllegionaminic acid synthase